MRDTVYKRQNDEDILELLYAQRKSYDYAVKCNRVGWGLVLLLFILEMGKLFIPFLDKSFDMINLILSLGVFVVDYKTKVLINWGSETKGLIDNILFGFPIENKEKIVQYAISIKNKNKENYRLQTSCRGDDSIKGVRDWYTEYNAPNHYMVILNCQKENIWWNKKLVNYYKKIIIFFMAVSVLFLLAFVSYFVIKIYYAWGLLILGVTILIRSIEQILSIRIFSKAMEHAQAKVELIEAEEQNLNLQSLCSLQKDIQENRKSGFLIPNWVYYFYSKQFHEERRQINEHFETY